MVFASAKALDKEAIPVVDISAANSDRDADSVAAALHAASTNLGFIYIKGHGIPSALIENARKSAYQFFHASPEQKQAVIVSPQHRGWLSQGAAKMQDNAKSDLKESFIWGFQDQHGNTPTDHALRGPNQWPAHLPAFENDAMSYFNAAHKVAFQLMHSFARGLGLPKTFFVEQCDKPLSRASYVYYPPQPPELGEDQFGVAAHTDFGVLTVLCQDNTGGLQVQGLDGEWLHAPPIEDTLVVNVGDLLARWTNGVYKSTPHRVVNSSGQERLSLVLAFDPNPETQIDAQQVFGTEHDNYPEPITCGDYLVWRFAKAFAYRQDKKA